MKRTLMFAFRTIDREGHAIMGRIALIGIAAVLLVALAPQSSIGQEEPSAGPALGWLRIDGQHIERLVLRDEWGLTVPFDRPAGSVELVVGRYRVMEIVLDGGSTSRDPRLVEIREGEEAALRAGAPLSHRVQAQRRGRYVVLGYTLRGQGGEEYAGRGRSHPPRFVVRKNGKQIATGRFEYG